MRRAYQAQTQVGISTNSTGSKYFKQRDSLAYNVSVNSNDLLFFLSAPSDDDDEVVAMIKELLDTRIR